MSVVCAEESGQPGIFSFPSLYHAYLACRKRKRNTVNALSFEAGLLDHLFDLGECLADGAYKPTRSVCFVTGRPKLREIFAADFRDRVVHHLLVPELEKIYEPKFIFDSYACRKNKGTHAAVERLRSFMIRITKGGRIPAWFLQLDIKSYFMSIDREILLNIVAGKVRDQALLTLARTIVTHDCTGNYLLKGSPALHARVPPGKSLFTVAPGKGLPIGNLTSQFFANVYLNELDQFVKHELKVRFYLRYMDDFILLAHSPEALLEMKGRIEDFLDRQLKLSLKSGHILKRVNEGADFLGYIVRPDYQLCRQRVVGNLKEKLGDFEKKLTGAGAVGRDRYTALNLYAAELAALRQTLASYLGHFKHANCRRLVFGLFERYAWLKEIFSFDPCGYRLVPRYEPPFIPASFREQYGWFAGACPGCCLFVQVGRFFELHTSQAVEFGPRFGLKPAPGRAGVRCGFPVGMLRTFKDKARRARISYVVVGERGRYGAGLKKRVVTEKLIFGGASSPIPAIVSC